MYSVVLRLQLCCLLALMIVSPVFATITLYDELRNKTLPLPSINFFQKELASYNHTSAWAIPAWKRNCTITEYVNKNDQDAVPHVRNTIVVPDLRSVWSMGCTSYFEVINAILASDEHLKKKDFPPIRGIIIPSPLPNEAAGGPEDAYCAGGVLLNSTQNAIPDIMKTGRASINNATYECEHPNFVNSGGEPVAVVIISQNTSQRIEKWFNDAINEFGEFDPRVKIEPEEGPWNEAFQTAGHKATQCTIVVMSSFLLLFGFYTIYKLTKLPILYGAIRIFIVLLTMVSLCLHQFIYLRDVVCRFHILISSMASTFLGIESTLILLLWTMRMPYTNLLVTWIFMGFLFTILLFLSGVLLWTIIAPTHYLNHQADIYLAPQIAAIVLIIIFTYFTIVFACGKRMKGKQRLESENLGSFIMQSSILGLNWVFAISYNWFLNRTVTSPSGRLALYISYDIAVCIAHCVIIVGISKQTMLNNKKPKPVAPRPLSSGLWYHAKYREENNDFEPQSNLQRSKTVMTHASRKTTIVI